MKYPIELVTPAEFARRMAASPASESRFYALLPDDGVVYHPDPGPGWRIVKEGGAEFLTNEAS